MLNRLFILLFAALFVNLTLTSCAPGKHQKNQENPVPVQIPEFNEDSAYAFVKAQVDFGPRVPNTSSHQQCGDYLIQKFRSYGDTVFVQNVSLVSFDGVSLQSRNIICSFNPEATRRIMFMSHWDSRPWADQDADPANHKKPVPGANDGASGVGILMEMARQLSIHDINVGVDLILFDSEDLGAPAHIPGDHEDTWCLGSQYWARNPHVSGYKAEFGVLLDMVGAPGATFYKEQVSVYYASKVTNKIWANAESLGYSAYFINQTGGMITDDHLYVNQIAGIPSVDVIQYNLENGSGFGEYWHTVHDDMSVIDKNTLKVVGTTMMFTVFKEDNN